MTSHPLPILADSDPDEARRARISAELQNLMVGEVRFSRHERMLYATDASIYQVEPIGVVVPRSIEDVERMVRYCRERRLPILPRGGGTSLAGQAVNDAVVIDFAPYCQSVLSIDAERRQARVEPGVVLAHLNQALAGHGLMFGPDVATATHANLGGMIGNNSSGAHSVLYGRTVEHLLGLDVVLADGEQLKLQAGAAERDERVRKLTQQVADVVLPLADQIDERYPKILRHVDGYNLDLMLEQLRASTPGTFDRVNLAHLFCGSEGTLGVTVGATLRLVEVPKAKGLAIVSFADVDEALRAVSAILETKPAALELLDDVVLGLAGANAECRRYVELLPGDANGTARQSVLYVEYFAENQEGLLNRFDALVRELPSRPVRKLTEPTAMARAWTLRAAGEPLLHGLPGERKPLTFVEDAAVDPRDLPEFIREFRELIAQHGTTAAYYAHASVGCLHVRPLINLRDRGDVRAMQRIAEELCDLVKRYGGSLSGEHGDGRLRSHLLRRYFGDEIVDAFRRIKAVFDPQNLMNPGNLVESLPMTEQLRIKPQRDAEPWRIEGLETYFRYECEHGFGGAVEMCNGAGVCRKMSGGTMCPSYRATLDERHATRGRGNALRLAISGQFSTDGQSPAWDDPETLATLDLCLSCKACKSECPSNVDIARLKAEFLAHRYDVTGRVPLKARVFGNVRALNRIGSAVAPLANALNRFPLTRMMMNCLAGIDARRSLPRFERSLYQWHRRHVRSHEARCAGETPAPPAVVLFPDCFTVYNEPEIGRAAIETLEALGYRVVLPRVGCCGRSTISLGMLREATAVCTKTASELLSVIEEHQPVAIVGCEPSCVSAITDDWQDLKIDVDRARLTSLANLSMLVEDFIALRWGEHPQPVDVDAHSAGPPVLLHGHCHQKALYGLDTSSQLLAQLLGERLRVLDSGCCGMAGAFGYTRDHYDLSIRIGELSVFPPIREDAEAIVLAPGTSCRHQIRDATSRQAIHPVQLLRQAIAAGSNANSNDSI